MFVKKKKLVLVIVVSTLLFIIVANEHLLSASFDRGTRYINGRLSYNINGKRYAVHRYFNPTASMYRVGRRTTSDGMIEPPLQTATPTLLKETTMADVRLCKNTTTTTFSSKEWEMRLCNLQRNATRCPNRDITVITGFINIGEFSKHGKTRSSDTYREWMKGFRFITNDVIAYFDDVNVLEDFRSITNNRSNIRYTHIRRETLWSLRLLGKIRELIKQTDYPRRDPSLGNPKYICATHAKFELTNHAVTNDATKQNVLWIDIGYFRHLSKEKGGEFGLYVPNEFDTNKIMFTQMNGLHKDMNIRKVFELNSNYVAAGAFLGTRQVMAKFTRQYKRFVEIFMSKKLMGPEQQIISGMYVDSSNRYKPEIMIKPHSRQPNFNSNQWFQLGHLCRVTWMTFNCLDR